MFAILTAFLFLSVAQAARFEVRVPEKSTVRVGDPVRLGTLIKGEIADRDFKSRIYDVVVFEPLTTEGERTFESEQLALTLRQKLSFQDLQKLSLKIPEQFKIQARRNYIYPSDITREITEQALALCGQCDIEFEDLKLPELKTRDEILQTHLETSPLKAAGSFLLPLRVETSQGKTVYWVTGRISMFKTAPVAKRLIQANDRIAESDFEMKRVNVSFAKDGVPSGEELAGKLASRTLNAGQTIFAGDLKKEPAAKRGQSVKILVGNETFEISSTGTAEEGGSIGDIIKVKSADNQKIFSGVLIDRATVRVQ